MGGLLKRMPLSGGLLMVGLFAVTGSPPFGMFISEFTILGATLRQGHPWIAAITLALLAIIFVGLATTILEALYRDEPEPLPVERESALRVGGPVVLAALTLLLGLYLPAALRSVLADAARALGGSVP
jgi:hydrogenase-4 component F